MKFNVKDFFNRGTQKMSYSELPNDFICRAASLDEILSDAFTSSSQIVRNAELGAKRLAAWCRSSSNSDWNLFKKRLERNGLTIYEVLTRFSTATPTGKNMEWVNWSHSVYKTYLDKIKSEHSFYKRNGQIPFEDIFTPLLNLFFNNNKEGLNNPIFAPEFKICIENDLITSLSNLTGKLFLDEFESYKASIQADTVNGNLYDNFIIYMLNERLIKIFQEKPVLLRLISTKVKQWVESSHELISRLINDFDDIKIFFEIESNARILKISNPESDLHNGGRSVRIINISSNQAIVYKPKNLDIDLLWNEFVKNIHDLGAPISLKCTKTLSRREYGWTEFIHNDEADSIDDIANFYRRSGALLAIFHIWSASDMHDENIIASKDKPIPIDLEMLLQPTFIEDKLDDPAFSAEIKAREIIYNSVFQVGLLPAYSRINSGEVVAQGGITPQENLVGESVWIDINTSSMKLVARKQLKHNSTNLPKFNGVTIPIYNYVDNFIGGFSQTIEFINDKINKDFFNKNLLIDNGISVRKVIRPTRFYHLLLKRMQNVLKMNDGVIWSAEADFVARFANLNASDNQIWNILESERHSLVELNIPFFTVHSNGTTVFDYRGKVSKRSGTSGLNKAKSRLLNLNNKEIRWQEDAIRYATSHMSSGSINSDIDPIPLKNLKVNENLFLNTSKIIADHLVESSIESNNTRSWIGFDWFGDTNINQLEPLGYDLYNGIVGIALFLSAHAKVSKENHYFEIAHSSLSGLIANINSDRGDQLARRLGIGGLFGMGSIVYGLTKIAEISHNEEYLSAAINAALLINEEMIINDKQLDLAGGVSGAALGLTALYRSTGNPKVLDIAIACGKHLLNSSRINSENGRSWVIPQSKGFGLNGLSHGASGFALSLYRLWECTQDQDFLKAVLEAVTYENDSFCEFESNWPDHRSNWDSNVKIWQSQWCHGGVGIGLSRLVFLKGISDNKILQDIQAAIKSSDKNWPRANDTVCCGSMGTAEFFLQAGKIIEDKELIKKGKFLTETLINSAISNGGFKWFGNHKKYHYGLFRGMSGLGYSILRQNNSSLPCLLVYE
jgi:type 2 lantibiotic biosynthesis protein LanM